MKTEHIVGVAVAGLVVLGVMPFTQELLPALRERYMPESVLYSGALNTAILERGDWAHFTLQGKKFYGPVRGCRWSMPLAVIQWSYVRTANQNDRNVASNSAFVAWKNLVAAGTCVETRPVWYAVEDFRVTPGLLLASYSPGLRRTVPGIATIRIDGADRPLYVGVNIPIGNGA